MSEYPAIKVTRKKGGESFLFESRPLGFALRDFWQWAASDLTGNALRGVLAEYIVATALNKADGVRAEWDAYDICSSQGYKVEVKSAAYIQSWKQNDRSPIRFNIRPTLGWYAETNEYSQDVKRQADVYVFAVLEHVDQKSVDPLNLNQWAFYVLRANKLNVLGSQKSIALSSLRKLGPIEVNYSQIAVAVEQEARNGS